MPHVLIINGALGGSTGNTAELLAIAEERLTREASVAYLELVREPTLDRILAEADRADAFIFGTGTYWDSWGSPLQRFFEMTAHTEGMPTWFGKPMGAVVTAHAVGAKSVLSRLLGVANVYGMQIPPLAGMAYTWANDVALATASDHLRNELWKPQDVEVVCHNVLEMVSGRNHWISWSTCEGKSADKWLHAFSGRTSA